MTYRVGGEIMSLKDIKNGLITENPTFVQLIGMCPTLAVTTTTIDGLSMGLATTAVLIGSNLVISLLRKVIPDKIRIPAFVVIIAAFVSLIQMLMNAYLPALYASLGLYIPLIVVNCIILARAEAFASKNGPIRSIADGLGMGLGFTLGLTILATVRELLGAGSIFGFQVFGQAFKPAILMILPPGAFLALGSLIAFSNWFKKKRAVNS